jgi:hypothetical protein
MATLYRLLFHPEDLLQFLYYIYSIVGNASKIIEENTFS